MATIVSRHRRIIPWRTLERYSFEQGYASGFTAGQSLALPSGAAAPQTEMERKTDDQV